eukprot:3522648-Rhodomonas_salina.5
MQTGEALCGVRAAAQRESRANTLHVSTRRHTAAHAGIRHTAYACEHQTHPSEASSTPKPLAAQPHALSTLFSQARGPRQEPGGRREDAGRAEPAETQRKGRSEQAPALAARASHLRACASSLSTPA